MQFVNNLVSGRNMNEYLCKYDPESSMHCYVIHNNFSSHFIYVIRKYATDCQFNCF